MFKFDKKTFTLIFQLKDFKIIKKKFDFYIEVNSYSSIEDIITMLEYIFNYYRQNIGIFSLHGTALYKYNKGIYLMGSISGIGKTSLGIELSTKYNFKLIGDENILINSKGEFINGNNYIKFNKKILNKYYDENQINNIINKFDENANVPIKMNYIIIPIICKSGELEVENREKEKINFHIYEELTRRIRGVSRRINNYSIPLQSLDSKNTSLKRSKTSILISETSQAMLVKGDINTVANFINKIYND